MTDDHPWTTRTTTDRETIREWVEAREADPAHVKGTGEGGDLGVLRIDFPEPEPDANLEPVSWDDFFAKFEAAGLAFRYQDEKKNGERSYFHRFVRREAAPAATGVTTDRDTIREWAESRGAEPAHVPVTGDDEPGALRLDFASEETEELEGLVWDAFFEKFDRENLAFEFARALEYDSDEDADGDVGERDEVPAETGERPPAEYHRFVHREETGVADAPETDASVVAVGTSAPPTDPDTEESEAASAETEATMAAESEAGASENAGSEANADSEAPDRPEMESASGMNTRSPAEADGPARRPELTAGLVVDEIHEDARGYDDWNRNDEYLVFRNDGEEPLDLTGWRVENADGRTYEFPEEFVLEPGRSVTVHTGSGEDTDEDLYWGSDRAVWKNTGDTLTVRDAEDRRVIRVSY
ncbi:lamin tail domain-containing protein [Halorussus sp. AFM4]|uniref:lamin tail domain-containing protein n=1 Tax=Halorussus sp. AFM4 TaxID=3421651 RepID=UPI003EBDB7BE